MDSSREIEVQPTQHTVGTGTDDLPEVPTVVMASTATQLDRGDDELSPEVEDVADSPFLLSRECGIASPCELPPGFGEGDGMMSHDSVKGEASARTSAATTEAEFVIDEGSDTSETSSSFSVTSDSPAAPSYEAAQTSQRTQQEARRESLRVLGEQVEVLVRQKLTLTPFERMQREEFANTIKGILREVAGQDCELHIHGSYATDLALKESDIDFLASEYSPQQPLTVFENMEKGLLSFGLPKGVSLPPDDGSDASPFSSHHPSPTVPQNPANMKEGPIFIVQSIKFTRVPIIKVTDRRTGLKGDISFAGGQHFDSMKLTKRLLRKHPHARSMLLFLKYIVGRLGIGDSVQGGITSFVLYLLTSHFFQVVFSDLGGHYEEPKAPPATNSGIPEAAAQGLRRAMGGRSPPREVTQEIESFLVGVKAEPTYHSRPLTPVDEGSRVPNDEDDGEPVEDRPLGELLYLFFMYYHNFNFLDCGLHFSKDGRSRVVEKPSLNRERRQHLHMTSPFDETFDVTSRMHCTQQFESLCRHMFNVLSMPDPQLENLLHSLQMTPHDPPHGMIHFDHGHQRYQGHIPHHHRVIHNPPQGGHGFAQHTGRKYGGYVPGGFPYQPSYWPPEATGVWAPSHHPQPRLSAHHIQAARPHQPPADQTRRTATPEPREGKTNASAGPESRNQAATQTLSPHPAVYNNFPLMVPMYIHAHQFQHNHNMNSSPLQSTAYPPTGGPNQPGHSGRDSHRNSPALGPKSTMARGRGRGGYSEGRVLTPGYHDPHKPWPAQRRNSKSFSDGGEKLPVASPSEENQKSLLLPPVKQDPPSKLSQPAAKYVPPHARKKKENSKESESYSADAGSVSPPPEQ